MWITDIELDGPHKDNYELTHTTAQTTANIARRAVFLTGGIVASDKVYDGLTEATLDVSGAVFSRVIEGDRLEVRHAAGYFDDKDAGFDKTVTIVGVTLGGVHAHNYVLVSDTLTTKASILPRPVMVATIPALDKTYDGTTSVTLDLSQAEIDGMIPGDQLWVASAVGAFEDEAAGKGKNVSIREVILGGQDVFNYKLVANTSSATADITPKEITLDGLVVAPKTFDGTKVAVVTNYGELVGVLAGDQVLLDTTEARARFVNAAPGVGKIVSVTGIKLVGDDAGNYVLAPVTGTGEIVAPALPGEPQVLGLEPLGSAFEPAVRLSRLNLGEFTVQLNAAEEAATLVLPSPAVSDPDRRPTRSTLTVFRRDGEILVARRTVEVATDENRLGLTTLGTAGPAEDNAFFPKPQMLGDGEVRPVATVPLELATGARVELAVQVAADGGLWVRAPQEAIEAYGENALVLLAVALAETELGIDRGAISTVVLYE